MKRKAIATLAAVAVLAVAGGAAVYLRSARPQASGPPAGSCPFAVREKGAAAPTPEDPARLAKTYAYVQERLVRCGMSAQDVALARRLFPDVHAHASFAASVKRGAHREAYRQFIQAPANPDVLYDYFAGTLPRVVSRGLDQPEVLALRLAWSWANAAQAALNAYRYTGEERFLDLVVPHFNEIMAKRDVVTGRLDETVGRPSQAWSSKVGDSKKWKAVITHAGRLTAPMAEFVLLVNTRPALARYRVQAERLLPAIEAAVSEFDIDYRVIAQRSAGYYVRREFGDVEPLNHMHAFGETLVLLYRITGKEEYQARVAELGRYFAAAMFEQPNGTRVWGYQPTPENLTQHKPEPVWKAQVTIRFPLQGYLNGVVFTQDDARNLAAVFTRNVHRGSGSFATSIAQNTGHTFDKGSKRQVALARTLALWIYLDRVDPAVRELIEEAVARDTSIFPGGWLQDYAMAEAYSHRLAPPVERRR